MKKLEIGTGGHRFFPPDDLTHLNEAVQESAAALAKLFGDNFYLTDTIIVNNGGFYQCAAGLMMYKGELCYFDAQNVATDASKTLCWVPVTTYRSLDPISYADASSKSPHVIKKVKLEMVNMAAPPADYSSAYANFAQKSRAILNAITADWITVGDGGTLKTAAWDNVLSPDEAELRRNIIDDVLVFSLEYQFKGGLVSDSLTLALHDSTTMFTIPASLRPKRDLLGCVPVIIKTNAEASDDTFHTAVCKLTTDGDFIVYAPTGVIVGNKMVVYLDGLILHEHAFQL